MENEGIVTPWSSVGYITYRRTYSRQMEEGKYEEWGDTVERVINACKNQLQVGFTDDEEARLRGYMLQLKGTVAGRFLWQLGTETVNRLGLMSLQNCALVVVDSPIRPFTWTFDALMLGSGVGYNIQREYVYKLPAVSEAFSSPVRLDRADADFICPDTREGWVALLERTLEYAYGLNGKSGCFSYSTQLVRGKGAPISGFGGVASGPEDLVRGISQISGVLENRRGKQLRPIDCLDIMNIIGSIVVAGNVRRSAQIAIGDCDDLQFLKAKNWSEGNIPNWRAMSNNSVVCNNINHLPEEFWKTYQGGSEPYGLINLKLARGCGRTGDTRYKDRKVMGFNPSLRAGTRVWTKDGVFPIESLQDKKFVVRNLDGNEADAECWLSDPSATLYRVKLKGGHEYYATAEHKWPVYTPFGYVKGQTTDLKKGMMLPVVKHSNVFSGDMGDYEDGFFLGWLTGDGGVNKYDGRPPQLNLIVSDKDCEGSDLRGRLIEKLNSLKSNVSCWNKKRGSWLETQCSAREVVPWLDSFGWDGKESLPSKIWNEWSEDCVRGFIDGLFSSDGCISSSYKNARISLSSKNETLVRDVSDLLGFYGIKSYVTTSYPTVRGVKYQQWHVRISERSSIIHFRDTFKLSVAHKQEKLLSISTDKRLKPVECSHYVVDSVEKTDMTEPVWDVTVHDDTHCFQLAHVVTGNCAEQSLNNFETCCLAEIFLPNIGSYDEFVDVAKLLYRVNKHSLALPCHHKETEAVVHENMRMGIGVTGYLQATEEQRGWLAEAYEELREYDKEYSKEHGWPESIKLTTCKPSGTLSLLPGVTPGIHPAYAQYMIRRIRIASDHPLVETCRNHGYHIEYQQTFDGDEDRSTVVVEFPFSYPEGTVLAQDLSAIDQLEWVKRLQTEWSDNSVSCTVYYRAEELDDIKAYLKKNYNKSFKTVSFLLHSDHGFVQAPYESIAKERYDELVANTTIITRIEGESVEYDSDDECSTGICPIK